MSAKRPIRRAQLISPFGIGAMVNFPKDESLMPAGLDAWPSGREECPTESGWLVREERLEARLSVSHFRMPPDYREEGGDAVAYKALPFVRFPRWHYCHRCGLMKLLSIFGGAEHCQGGDGTEFENKCRNEYERSKAKKFIRSPRLIPVRFIAACELGHVQDFPFMEWLHRDKPFDFETHRLKLRAGRSSAGLSGITIECSCQLKRSLGNVFEFDNTTKRGPLSREDVKCLCKGLRPWLGEMDQGAESCSHGHLRVLQRGATNVYFPHVVSSIYLPLWADQIGGDVVAVLEQPQVWSVLSQGTVNGRIDPMRCQMIAQLRGVDEKQLEVAAQRKLDGVPVRGITAVGDEEDFRRSEYLAICGGKVGPQTELYVECANLMDFEPDVSRLFSRICLVHKLRETRALTGFTRILPPDGNLASDRLQRLHLDQRIDWLPAIKVYGEGIFVELHADQLNQWIGQEKGILRRIEPLTKHYNDARTARQQPHRRITAKFLLLHTLAHVLVNQLSFDCGYGSASLRERLYCDFSDPNQPMHGLLIYTASGDSEGTMGGLVRQGRPGRFETTLRRALQQAAWCSSDPICIESKGQGFDSTNLAACHGCCLLPETSCEEGNRLLDRALLVGSPARSALGYFHSLLK